MKRLIRLVSAMTCCAWAPSLMAAEQVYTIDPTHTFITIQASHQGLSQMHAMFTKVSGKLWLDRDKGTGKVDVTIDATSLTFGSAAMDRVIQGEDYLNGSKFSAATYKSDSMTFKNGKAVAVNGELTLLGVSKPVKLTIDSFTCMNHPMLKRDVCGADAHGELDRSQFGMTKGADSEHPIVRILVGIEAIAGDLPAGPPGGGAGGRPGGGPPPGAGPNGGPPPGGFPAGGPPAGGPPGPSN